ncbi:MAG TPA: hypothetical protein VLD67_00940 [Vicinamibacterales bacterium]|nr:hypothetical protein [Vicinamibacterales bacterium]
MKIGTIVLFCGLWVFAALGAWVGLVPERLSAVSFAWANLLTLLLIVVGSAVAARGRPTRSIAHVIHDVEHPSAGRATGRAS